MVEESLEDFKEDFPLLIEAGFVAVKQLDEVSATRIFHASDVLSPGHPASKLGVGYIHMNKLELKEASKVFEEILAEHPDHNLAEMFLGICCLLNKAKRKQGEKIIKEVMGKTDDPTVVNLGQVSLDWASSELKKSEKPPFFPTEQKK